MDNDSTGSQKWIGVHRLGEKWTALQVLLNASPRGVTATVDLDPARVVQSPVAAVHLQSCLISLDLEREQLRFRGKFKDGTISGTVKRGNEEAPFFLVRSCEGADLFALCGLYSMGDSLILIGEYEDHLTFLLPETAAAGELRAVNGAFAGDGHQLMVTGQELFWSEPGRSIPLSRVEF